MYILYLDLIIALGCWSISSNFQFTIKFLSVEAIATGVVLNIRIANSILGSDSESKHNIYVHIIYTNENLKTHRIHLKFYV